MFKRLLVLALIFLVPAFSGMAEEEKKEAGKDIEKKGKFSVTSDHRSFNPFNASYTLKGNVVAKFYNRYGYVEIRADKGVAHFFTQKIKAEGNVQLVFNETYIRCDKTVVFNSKKQAYLYGNIYLKKDNDVITAPEARYNWRERIGNFVNANKNGQPVEGEIVLTI